MRIPVPVAEGWIGMERGWKWAEEGEAEGRKRVGKRGVDPLALG